IIGTDPGWEVSVAEPVISIEKKGSDKMEYADSPELPVGQELVVETASDGFDVTLYRAVYKDGKLIDEYASSSAFTPARNLTLRGTGPAQ
ncbi:MAG: G5 domain-containing protein, partial [Chloroflexota bacterium]